MEDADIGEVDNVADVVDEDLEEDSADEGDEGQGNLKETANETKDGDNIEDTKMVMIQMAWMMMPCSVLTLTLQGYSRSATFLVVKLSSLNLCYSSFVCLCYSKYIYRRTQVFHIVLPLFFKKNLYMLCI
jgi:hypothetical protein